ncbi:MAG: hypothetical protein OEU54_14665 [Gemmatimonadota bacterium]|nr:hypothetical protein [Gemmatimonadota bacterium]
MGRNIGAAVLGYVAMFAAVFGGMTVAWTIVGADGAFQPGSWDHSMLWAVVSVVVGLVAAVLGGIVCARVGTDRTAVYVLVGLVAVLGVLSAIPEMGDTAAGPRPDGLSMWDAIAGAVQPTWARWANPVIGIVGVLVGASRSSKA